jgi:hypothetical protein
MRERVHALERVIVRMLYDPSFADAVCRDPAHALPGLGLGEREHAWLGALDPRAFGHDPLRGRRTLRALCEELPASSAIAVNETRSVAFLDHFFASEPFHRAVQERGSLVAAFADYLACAHLRTTQLPDVIRLEARLAVCRRALEAAGGRDYRPPPIPIGGPSRVARAPGVDVATCSRDALAAVQAAERFLFEARLVPILALADDAPRLELPAPAGGEPVSLGLVPTESGISLVELEPPLYDALARVDSPSTPVDRIGRALALELCADEVLIAVS